MSLIVPHRTTVQGHAQIPYLFRAFCSCGWEAFAGNEGNANLAAQQHLIEEEPFPDAEAFLDPSNPPDHLK